MGLRVFGFVAILAALCISGYVFVGKARSGDLNPVTEVDEAAQRAELASAQYVLGIVSAQLAQVKVLSGSYAGTLDFDEFPLVTLVRADELSYCLEFEKTHTFFLAGPGGTVAEGRC
ncbi:MAG: hypothetical protein ACRDNB_01345 [Gaiellaceae bacterium]